MPTVTDYTAILSGTYWNGIDWTSTPWTAGQPLFVTYSFPTSSPDNHANVTGLDRTTFEAFSAADQDVARQALAAWDDATGITFLEVAPGEGQIQFAWYDFSSISWAQFSGGFAFYPFGEWDFSSQPNIFGDDKDSADVFVNTDYRVGGVADYGLLLHELGHAIGLKHPDEVLGNGHDEVLDPSLNDTAHTIMSYNVVPGGPALGPLDIAAGQYIYGTDAQDGTQVASWSWDPVTETLTQTGFNTADTIIGTSVHDVILSKSGDDRVFALGGDDSVDGANGNDSLWGGTGDDTMAGGSGQDLLRGWQGDDSLTGGGSDDTLQGEADDDTLVGSDGRDWMEGGDGNDSLLGGNGGDLMFGGAGNDTLLGGLSGDTMDGGDGDDTLSGDESGDSLIGGAGNDSFRFNDASQSAPGSADTISGFDGAGVAGGDVIRLTGIDANTLVAGNQAFTFIGTAAFSHTAGELRVSNSADNTLVRGDVNGDGNADLQILIQDGSSISASTYTAADFLL